MKKPPKDAKLIEGHPLTKGLQSCYIYDEEGNVVLSHAHDAPDRGGKMGASWDRVLTPEEIQQLHADPYCFFERSLVGRVWWVKLLIRIGRWLRRQLRSRRL